MSMLLACCFAISCAHFHKQHYPVFTIFAGSDVQILKETRLLHSLVLAFCFRARFGDTSAAWSNCVVTEWVKNFCCTQKQGQEQTVPCQYKQLKTEGVKKIMSCKHLSDARRSLLGREHAPSKKNNQKSFWNFVTWCVFVLWSILSSGFKMQTQRNLINYFGYDWRRRLLHLRGNGWNNWGVENFCVFIVKWLYMLQAFGDIKYRGK